MNEKIIKYDFAKEFFKIPGPRFKSLGDASGEEFRDKVVRPYIKQGKVFDLGIKKKQYSKFKQNISDKLEQNTVLYSSWIVAEFQSLLKK